MPETHPAPTAEIDLPIPALTFVFPAAGPTSVTIDGNLIHWTDHTGVKWEADATDDRTHYAVYTPNGDYGIDEEDYALVPAADLLDVIAHGYGDAHR